MLLLKTLREYYEKELADEIREVVSRAVGEEGYPLDEPLENLLGGDIFVAESIADLEKIPAWNIDGNEGDNVTTTIGSWDVAEKLSDNWAFLWLATNNSGGPAYFIPAELWEACQLYEQLERAS